MVSETSNTSTVTVGNDAQSYVVTIGESHPLDLTEKYLTLKRKVDELEDRLRFRDNSNPFLWLWFTAFIVVAAYKL